MGSEHLSSYEVIYEEDTPLYAQLQAKEFDVNEDLACEMYEELVERATAAGFRQYEIANFARNARQPYQLFSTLPFSCGRYGQHTSTPIPRSSATPANVGFHSVTIPSRPHRRATVFGRSNTATSGMPPNAAR